MPAVDRASASATSRDRLALPVAGTAGELRSSVVRAWVRANSPPCPNFDGDESCQVDRILEVHMFHSFPLQEYRKENQNLMRQIVLHRDNLELKKKTAFLLVSSPTWLFSFAPEYSFVPCVKFNVSNFTQTSYPVNKVLPWPKKK